MSAPRMMRWLAIVVGVALVAVAFVAMARQGGRTEGSSVDAGFARDMSAHHAQAVQMAAYTQDHASTSEIRALASTISHQQQLEIGQMLGWLEAWGLPRAANGPAMAWMPAGNERHHHGASAATAATMPGMATPVEMDGLLNLQGKKLEVRFLQLMIRHHQGGLPMAKAAARKASHPYVRALAAQMAVSQGEETDRMMQLLVTRGGRALPAP